MESLIFAFAIGGIGAVLYDTVTGRNRAPMGADERGRPLHRFHLAALFVPPVLFVPLYLLPCLSG